MTETFRTPEGRLIREGIDKAGMSIRSVAREVPISDTQLRAWYRGFDRRGEEVHFPPRQLAKTALVLGLTADDLRGVNRTDAADILADLSRNLPAARVYTPEEIARMLDGMAKRIGDLEEENDKLRERMTDLDDTIEM